MAETKDNQKNTPITQGESSVVPDPQNMGQDEFGGYVLQAIFNTSKKTVQEYVLEIARHNRYKSVRGELVGGCILDDRSRLIDLYESAVQQDAHLRSVLETLESQILGDRYMLGRVNEKGKLIKDQKYTEKIQGSQFDVLIKGIAEAKLYGFSLLELLPKIDPLTGKLKKITVIERRNVLPDQNIVLKRTSDWSERFNLLDEAYQDNYVLINTGDLGLFSATTPLVLAKKFTVANYVNFSHTYGQPIIHGKAAGTNPGDRQRLANNIASGSQNKIIVTGLEDDIDVKAFTMSNSEKVYTGLIGFANEEMSNLILGSESMAGGMQSYVGSTKAHQDIFRDRIKVYRRYIENVMNEAIIPRLVKMGYLDEGLVFRYSNNIEMSNEDRIKLYAVLLPNYEIDADTIEKEFGVSVGKQITASQQAVSTAGGAANGVPISDEEYLKRYGHSRAVNNRIAAMLIDK